MQAIMETAFDIIYLITVIALGICMIRKAGGNRQYLLFGVMAVTLGCGDAFHLIPRAWALCTDGLTAHAAALGVGKFVTSITMTVFYLMLYGVWRERYQVKGQHGWTAAMAVLAAVRIVLCLMPQNAWLSADAPMIWGVWRNIPFALMGLCVIFLFARSAAKANDRAFRFMALTVALSFGFYIPVVLFSQSAPWVGALMSPKTCAYVWTVLIGFMDQRKVLSESTAR